MFGIGTEPSFAIGQRALLVQSPAGNLLWDCVTLLDDQTIERVNELGGIRAIAISHPHFYSAMVEWSGAFSGAPIHLHAADREWVMRDDPNLQFWEGTTHQLWDGMTLVNCGGHFDGGTVLHWPGGADGRGALLTGDIIHVAMDRRYLSFMRSYPNLIPLSAPAISQILERIEPFASNKSMEPGGNAMSCPMAMAPSGVPPSDTCARLTLPHPQKGRGGSPQPPGRFAAARLVLSIVARFGLDSAGLSRHAGTS